MDALLDAIIDLPVPPIPSKWSPTMADFVSKTLLKDPSERWSVDQLLGHPLFQNIEACR